MATLVLGAAGAAVGGSLGGSILGIGGSIVGRAVGASIGRALDQSILGLGSDAVDVGKVDRFRINGAAEGTTIRRVFGQVRVAGHVIWASRFKENSQTTGGSGKGAPKAPRQTSYSYSVSLAIALCEGQIKRVGRIWADGREIARDSISMRVYNGSEDQLPDPLLEAIEADHAAPAYRGTAYVVIEDLDLTPYGSRVPQFSFEVLRDAKADREVPTPANLIRGVALVPGTGEYSLSTTAVHYNHGGRKRESANVNTIQGKTDFKVAIENLVEEIPGLQSISLIVSWFGNDLRCGNCDIFPAVEQGTTDGTPLSWRVAGFDRTTASIVPTLDGRPLYGGTPSDQSIIEAIEYLNEMNIDVMFYPFILMNQVENNGLPDPWGGTEQANLPWRGRITTSLAPGLPGSPDGTASASDEVRAFFGECDISDVEKSLTIDGDAILTGPRNKCYRSFILHYAALCEAAGGVESFCIGSELRALTQVRGPDNSFPAVGEMIRLADDVRYFLPKTKIGYAADWSEYFGYHPKDTSDVYFHLDALWAHENIDFIGIDNYMPLSDWRDESEHADILNKSIYSLGYLKAGIEGGEGYDWFYPSDRDRETQNRVPIGNVDSEDNWVWRFKDIKGWWGNTHYNQVDGKKQNFPTSWRPQSKPIRFTEYGCAAIDKGTNQPNKFIDPKSSESRRPWSSNGRRDDFIQMQYIRALLDYWNGEKQNPESSIYSGRMIDLDHSVLWAWDARPWPAFPELGNFWSDSRNYDRGHWLSGRAAIQPLASVIAEICSNAGVENFDVSEVYGSVRGYIVDAMRDGRAELQPLLLAYGVEVVEQGGRIIFSMRDQNTSIVLHDSSIVSSLGKRTEIVRITPRDTPGRVRLVHIRDGGDFDVGIGDASFPGERSTPVQQTELPLVLTSDEGQALAERYVNEARVGQQRLELKIAPSLRAIRAGCVISVNNESGLWRVDRFEQGEVGSIEAVRIEPSVFRPSDPIGSRKIKDRPAVPLPVDAFFLNLPLIGGEEKDHAPYFAVSSQPWLGPVAVHASTQDYGYQLSQTIDLPCTLGETLNNLDYAAPGLWDNGDELLVRLSSNSLSSVTSEALFAGANGAAIGGDDPDRWEVFQFESVRLVEQGVWALRRRLRGQRGTEECIRETWPVGSKIVLLDGRPQQLNIGSAALGYSRHFRFGLASLPYDHDSYEHQEFTATGKGLRPFAPGHLSASIDGNTVSASWIRRSRLFDEAWDRTDIGLGELVEKYSVRILTEDGAAIYNSEVTETSWSATLSSDMMDGSDALVIEVAQISDIVGIGTAAVFTLER